MRWRPRGNVRQVLPFQACEQGGISCAPQVARHCPIGQCQMKGCISASGAASVDRDTGRWEGESSTRLSEINGSPLALSLACDASDTLAVAVLVLLRRERAAAVALLHTTRPRPSVMNGGSVSCTRLVARIRHCWFGTALGASPGCTELEGESGRWFERVGGVVLAGKADNLSWA